MHATRYCRTASPTKPAHNRRRVQRRVHGIGVRREVVVISCFLGARMTPGMRRMLSPSRIGWSSSDAELAIEGLTDEEWKAFEKALTER